MEEVIKRFNSHNVKYILIGGQAIRLLGMPRFSMDWDFYIPGKDKENINKINNILSDFLDTELEPLGEQGQNFIQTFQTIFGILQFHLTAVALPPFDKAYKNSQILKSESGIPVRCISVEDLYECKKKIHRGKDEDDILFLEALIKSKH